MSRSISVRLVLVGINGQHRGYGNACLCRLSLRLE